jgi:hypothetical protein
MPEDDLRLLAASFSIELAAQELCPFPVEILRFPVMRIVHFPKLDTGQVSLDFCFERLLQEDHDSVGHRERLAVYSFVCFCDFVSSL